MFTGKFANLATLSAGQRGRDVFRRNVVFWKANGSKFGLKVPWEVIEPHLLASANRHAATCR